MNCTDVKAQLTFLFSQNPDLIDELEIRVHLANCSNCQQEWQELTQLGRLLDANPALPVTVDLLSLYRRAAQQETRSNRRWRWLGMAASLLALVGGGWAIWGRAEIRLNRQELALRWGEPSRPDAPSRDSPQESKSPIPSLDRRDEQIEVLSAMVRAMVEELQTVELRQRRDRADLDVRVSGLQEQTLKRWLALQKDMDALYVLSQKGD
jgi:hypothetical protein